MRVLSLERRYTAGKALAALLKRVIVRCYEHGALNSAAQVSFYFALSMFPFFLMIAALLGWVPTSSGWQTFAKWLSEYFPVRTQDTLLVIMLGLSKGYRGFFSFGLILTLWSASTGFVSLREALTRAYALHETRSFLKRRMIALGATFLAAFILIAWFGIWSAGRTLVALVLAQVSYTPHSDASSMLLRWCTTLLMFGISVYLVSHFLPACPKARRGLTPGMIFATMCMSAMSGLFDFYMSHTSEMSQVYGALTGFIVMMLWIYFATLSLVVGAEADTAIAEFHAQRHSGA